MIPGIEIEPANMEAEISIISKAKAQTREFRMFKLEIELTNWSENAIIHRANPRKQRVWAPLRC